MVWLWISLLSIVAWFFSTLSGGGSPLILIPALAWIVEPQAIPPVITVGMLGGNFQRSLLYRQTIDWSVFWWFTPGAITGGILGAFLFSQLDLAWLPWLLGVFLVGSALSCWREPDTEQTEWPVKSWYFLPGGFVYAFLSGVVGSTGPILNVFYLNHGLVKESLLGTKGANKVVVHITKLLAYAYFGVLSWQHLLFGLVIAIAAWPGNWLGKKALEYLTERQFRRAIAIFVLGSGLLLFWQRMPV